MVLLRIHWFVADQARFARSDVIARVTADAVSGEILDSELARDITRSLEHTPLEGGLRDIQTIFIFEASKVRAPSPILQDFVM